MGSAYSSVTPETYYLAAHAYYDDEQADIISTEEIKPKIIH